MALETGNYINDLVITNPTSSDPKSAGDDHLRLLKKTLKETLNGFTGAILVTATDTGNATAHVLTPSTALIGYTPMLCLLYLPATTNTGAVTVNVTGLGAKSIKTMYGADPTAGDIVANVPMLLMYNGTNFLLLAGAGFMGLTGNQTLTGNLTITGSQTVSINQNVTGNQTVSGTSNLTTVVISGSATAPTVTAGDNSTKIATTAFVASALTPFALLASPVLTGTPTSTTAATGTNTTQIATCAFVMAQAFNVALPAQSGNAGKLVTTDGANASWTNIKTVGGVSILGSGNIITDFIPPYLAYDSRATLSSTVSADGSLYYVESLGLFRYVAGLTTEPGDDETCFVTASGSWLLENPHWDFIDATMLADESDQNDRAEDIETRATNLATRFTGRILFGTATSSGASIPALSQQSFTGAVTGALVGDSVLVTPPNALTAAISIFARVTTNDTVTVYLNNPSATAQAPAAGIFQLAIFRAS